MTISKRSMSDKSLKFLEDISHRKMTIGNLLWSIRECEEMTQVKFSELLGISRQYLCDVEQGRRTVSLQHAAKFADKLGYSKLQFIRAAIQDLLNKGGFNFDIDLHEHKDAA